MKKQLEEERKEKTVRSLSPEESLSSCSDSNLSPSEKKMVKYEKQAKQKEAMIRELRERSKPKRIASFQSFRDKGSSNSLLSKFGRMQTLRNIDTKKRQN